jgi:hypothetical protein
MSKPKTLRERSNDYAHNRAKYGDGLIPTARDAYIAGHRAGSRLTKAERDKVWNAAIDAAAKTIERSPYGALGEANAVRNLKKVRK